MDITSVFETDSAGSIPAGPTNYILASLKGFEPLLLIWKDQRPWPLDERDLIY